MSKQSLKKDIGLLKRILPTLVLPLEISALVEDDLNTNEEKNVENGEDEITRRLAVIICSLIEFHIDAQPLLNLFLLVIDNAEHLDQYSLALVHEVAKQLPSRATMIVSILRNALQADMHEVARQHSSSNSVVADSQGHNSSSSFIAASFRERLTPRALDADFSAIFARYRATSTYHHEDNSEKRENGIFKRDSKTFSSPSSEQITVLRPYNRKHRSLSNAVQSKLSISASRISRTQRANTSSPETTPPPSIAPPHSPSISTTDISFTKSQPSPVDDVNNIHTRQRSVTQMGSSDLGTHQSDDVAGSGTNSGNNFTHVRQHSTVELDTLLRFTKTKLLCLNNLKVEAMNEILSSRIRSQKIDEKVCAAIYETCHGNIAYGIELFDTWVSTGHLMFKKVSPRPVNDNVGSVTPEELDTIVVFVEGVEDGSLTLPSQLVDLFKRKMDRFVQTTKMIARLMSVVGVSLTLDDVVHINEKIDVIGMINSDASTSHKISNAIFSTTRSGTRDERRHIIKLILQSLSDLVRYGFLHHHRDSASNSTNTANYSFTCMAAREAIYNSMTYLERKQLHMKVGEWYETTFCSNNKDAIYFAAIVAYHAEAVGDVEKAVHLYEASASFGEMTSEDDDAIARFEDCLRLSDMVESNVLASTSIQWMKRVAGLHLRKGRPQRAIECLERINVMALSFSDGTTAPAIKQQTSPEKIIKTGPSWWCRCFGGGLCCGVVDDQNRERRRVVALHQGVAEFHKQLEYLMVSTGTTGKHYLDLADQCVPLEFRGELLTDKRMIAH
jgi:hypothetical protein